MAELNTINDIKNSLFFAREVYSRFFLPVAKLSHNSSILKTFVENGNSLTIETKFGKTEIRNRLLTEHHSRILSEIIKASKLEELPDGGLKATFSELEVLRALEMGDSNHTRLREYVKQIADAAFYVGIVRARKISIIKDHMLDSRGFQVVIFSSEYVEMNQLDFAIASSSIANKLRSLKVSTIPSIIKFIYITTEGHSNYCVSLDVVLEGLGLKHADKTIRTIKSWLKENKDVLKNDFSIIYNPLTKNFTTEELSSNLTFIRATFDESVFYKYLGLHIITEEKTSTIKEIKKQSYREYEIITDHDTLTFSVFIDDFLAYLDDLYKNKGRKLAHATSSVEEKKLSSLFD